MRLSSTEQGIIISTVRKFSPDASIYLFGSRVDDTKRGGDIDLFLSTSHPVSLEEKISMLTQFERRGIERKVDLVIQSPDQDQPTIYEEVVQKGIQLC